jgi:hypothetical protein
MADKALTQTAEVLQAIAAGMPACPICGGRNVRRSESVRFEDKMMGWLKYNPFRCRTCQHRFYKRPDQLGSAQTAG